MKPVTEDCEVERVDGLVTTFIRLTSRTEPFAVAIGENSARLVIQARLGEGNRPGKLVLNITASDLYASPTRSQLEQYGSSIVVYVQTLSDTRGSETIDRNQPSLLDYCFPQPSADASSTDSVPTVWDVSRRSIHPFNRSHLSRMANCFRK